MQHAYPEPHPFTRRARRSPDATRYPAVHSTPTRGLQRRDESIAHFTSIVARIIRDEDIASDPRWADLDVERVVDIMEAYEAYDYGILRSQGY